MTDFIKLWPTELLLEPLADYCLEHTEVFHLALGIGSCWPTPIHTWALLGQEPCSQPATWKHTLQFLLATTVKPSPGREKQQHPQWCLPLACARVIELGKPLGLQCHNTGKTGTSSSFQGYCFTHTRTDTHHAPPTHTLIIFHLFLMGAIWTDLLHSFPKDLQDLYLSAGVGEKRYWKRLSSQQFQLRTVESGSSKEKLNVAKNGKLCGGGGDLPFPFYLARKPDPARFCSLRSSWALWDPSSTRNSYRFQLCASSQRANLVGSHSSNSAS